MLQLKLVIALLRNRKSSSVRLAAAILVLRASTIGAQELEVSVSPSPVGSGARAAGMADAFVAIADDATAASWNPAGLVQLERPELSIVGSWNGIYEQFFAKHNDEFESGHWSDNVNLNYLSAVYPLPSLILGRNVVVSVNYQRKYDFARSFSTRFNFPSTMQNLTFANTDFEQEGGLSAITPAFAVELTHRLSVGVATNFWRSSILDTNGWTQETETRTFDFVPGETRVAVSKRREEYKDFQGENFTFGLFWSLNDRWSVGLRYETAFTADVDYRSTEMGVRLADVTQFPITRMPSPSIFVNAANEKRKVRLPATFAIGAAYRKSDRLTVALDLTTTDWNDFYVEDTRGLKRSLVDASPQNLSSGKTHFDRTYTVRAGFEYLFLPEQLEERLDHLWSVRGGLFYDQEPATGKKRRGGMFADRGNGDPESFYGIAAGVGLLYRQSVNFDLAYQLRYGDAVNRDYYRGVPGFNEDVFQHRILLSAVIYF